MVIFDQVIVAGACKSFCRTRSSRTCHCPTKATDVLVQPRRIGRRSTRSVWLKCCAPDFHKFGEWSMASGRTMCRSSNAESHIGWGVARCREPASASLGQRWQMKLKKDILGRRPHIASRPISREVRFHPQAPVSVNRIVFLKCLKFVFRRAASSGGCICEKVQVVGRDVHSGTLA